jgi:hypothetical protein
MDIILQAKTVAGLNFLAQLATANGNDKTRPGPIGNAGVAIMS